jgi:deoxyribose-phosphate aldolase
MTEQLTRRELLNIIDHTLLTPEGTTSDIEHFLVDAQALGLQRVCISPAHLPIRSQDHEVVSAAASLEVVTVVGFPSGAHAVSVKVAEAIRALNDGATELDFVANLGLIKAKNFRDLEKEFTSIREVSAGHPLKVILETACLSEQEIVDACRVARDTGCDFVKTSTGFHPAGGATVAAVELMATTVGPQVGVKASGGIRTADQVRQMLAAGATRLGLSATRDVLREWHNGEQEEETQWRDGDEASRHQASGY